MCASITAAASGFASAEHSPEFLSFGHQFREEFSVPGITENPGSEEALRKPLHRRIVVVVLSHSRLEALVNPAEFRQFLRRKFATCRR